jgi:hypothetical protein
MAPRANLFVAGDESPPFQADRRNVVFLEAIGEADIGGDGWGVVGHCFEKSS